MYKHYIWGNANYDSSKVLTSFDAILADNAKLLFYREPSYRLNTSSLSFGFFAYNDSITFKYFARYSLRSCIRWAVLANVSNAY